MEIQDNTQIEFSECGTKARYKYSDGTFSPYYFSRQKLLDGFKEGLESKKIIPCGYSALRISEQIKNAPKNFPVEITVLKRRKYSSINRERNYYKTRV